MTSLPEKFQEKFRRCYLGIKATSKSSIPDEACLLFVGWIVLRFSAFYALVDLAKDVILLLDVTPLSLVYETLVGWLLYD